VSARGSALELAEGSSGDLGARSFDDRDIPTSAAGQGAAPAGGVRFGGVQSSAAPAAAYRAPSRNSYSGPEMSFDVRFFWCCCCMFFTLLTIILVAVSIRDVDYGTWGVAYNKLTCTLNESPYEQGKHVMRPETDVLTYNALTISFESNMDSLTMDGLSVNINVQVQYALKRAELIDIVLEFGYEEALTEFLRKIAEDSIRDVAALNTAEDFYVQRGPIETAMQEQLIIDMANANAHVEIKLLQLTNIRLPGELMDAIEDKQRAELDITNANNEREGAVIQAETSLREAEINAETAIALATQEAIAVVQQANFTAVAITDKLTKRWEVWKDIKDNSGMTPTNFVNDYLTAVVISEVNNPMVGIRRQDDDA